MSKVGGLEKRKSTGRKRRSRPWFSSVLTFVSVLGASATPAASIASSIDYRYFVAGGTCAAISHGITCPIDVVKTRMQSNPSKYKSLPQSTAMIIKEEGVQALATGLGPTLVGYGIEGALKFGVYEVMKPLVVLAFTRALGANSNPGPAPFLIASITAGAIASLVLVPMESARIRMVTDSDFGEMNLVSGLRRLVEESGLRVTLTAGLGAMLAKQVPYTFGKQVSFDVVANILYKVINSPRSAGLTLGDSISKATSPHAVKWIVSVLAAMTASVIACLLSQPGDVILTETYKGCSVANEDEPCDVTKKNTLWGVSSTIYSRSEDKGAVPALSGFFTGLQARFLHVGTIITSQLVIYDIVKQLLGLPATGSH